MVVAVLAVVVVVANVVVDVVHTYA